MSPTAIAGKPSARWLGWELAALAAILATALALRLNEYGVAPAITDNGDEFDWAWMGLGLIRRGIPYGWSNLRVYAPGAATTMNGRYFEIIHPFLDHPPLFGFLVGAAAWLQGARNFTDVTPGMIRPVPILLSGVSLVLAYILGRRVLGRGPALVGIVLLATAPAAVLVQRQAEAESLLAPLLLGTLLLVARIDDGPPRRRAVSILLACCALAPLVKLSGVAIPAAAAALLVARGRWRLALAALAAGLAGVGAYLAYGALYDWQLLTRVINASADRRSGILGVYHFIVSPAGPGGAGQNLRDGWWLLGWLTVGVLALARRERSADLLTWPIAVYAVTIMLFAEHVSYYGWFRVSIYPLVYLLAGWWAWRAMREPDAVGILLLLVLGAATSINALFAVPGTESWAPNPYVLALALAIAVAPALVAAGQRDRPALLLAARYVGAAALAAAVVSNLAASAQLGSIFRSL